jgi:hypothetical protein
MANRERSTCTTWILGAWLITASVACTGNIDGSNKEEAQRPSTGPGAQGANPGAAAGGSGAEPGSRPGQVPPGTNPGGVDVECEDDATAGPTPLTKLSTLQYRNTVRDLLAASGFGSMPAGVAGPLASVPDDSLGDSFRALDNRISLEHVQAYFNVGVAAGDALVQNPALLRAVAGDCATTAPLSDSCARTFIERFAALAYRRPPSDDEIEELAALNDGVRTPAEAARAITIVVMSSPRFVNHVEIDGSEVDAQSDLLQLTGYEIASRLSYLFWQTMPDAELFAAAADGSLATEDGFAAQLERVFADDRTRETVWQFWNEWLRLEKFTGFETTRPGFAALAEGLSITEPGAGDVYYEAMVQEIRDLTDLFTFERTASLSDLLATELSVTPSAELATLYGVEPWDGRGEYPTLPSGTRAGLLQRAALLVSNLETTNPFHRGAFVRRNLLCDPLAQPDPNTLPPGSLDPPPLTATETTRERYQAKVAGNQTCQNCHGQFSDIGFVLESFDALGRHRTRERVFDEQTGELLAELPIDTSGVTRVELDDAEPVTGAAELNERVIASEKVEACLATKYFEFALRRAPAQALDSCTVDDLAAQLRDPQAGLREAFRRIAQHASFFLRKVGPQ